MPPWDEETFRRRKAGTKEYRDARNTIKRLMDSLIGGQTYRDATYGKDRYGLQQYNLIRHKRERPNPREEGVAAQSVTHIASLSQSVNEGYARIREPRDPAADSGVDDFELRRARTPTPEILADIIGEHIDRIARHEVVREGSAGLQAFWEDVNGRGDDIQTFVETDIGPIYLAVGKIDLLFQRPSLPEGLSPDRISLADEQAHGLKGCTCSPILPENLIWWKLDRPGNRYQEVLYKESWEDDDGNPVEYYRHWDPETTTLYDKDGETIEHEPHRYGAVPVLPVFMARKPGTRATPKSFYEPIADRMRAIYNLDSELVLSDTNQAHPILSVYEEWCQPDSTVPIGPGFVLPIKVVSEGSGKAVVPPQMLDMPKGPTDSLRRSIAQHTAMAYWHAGLEPPAPTQDSIDRQSGISKEFDADKISGILAKLARDLQRLENAIIEGYRIVTGDKEPAKVNYPSKFGVFSAEKLTGLLVATQKSHKELGGMPEHEKAVMKLIARDMDPGRSDEDYRIRDREIDRFIDEKVEEYKQSRKTRIAVLRAQEITQTVAAEQAVLNAEEKAKAAEAGDDGDGDEETHVPEGGGQPERFGEQNTPEAQGRKGKPKDGDDDDDD